MIRAALPVAFCLLCAPLSAQTLSLPSAIPDESAPLYSCDNVPLEQSNCVRVLACIGDGGIYFDGVARGWNSGTVTGFMSDGTDCTGSWTSGGLGGTGLSSLVCDGGLTADVIYYSQDNDTGTVIGRGRDSLGRNLRVWSGLNVLAYLSDTGEPALPCATESIPIS